jgi:hypothetical protein
VYEPTAQSSKFAVTSPFPGFRSQTANEESPEKARVVASIRAWWYRFGYFADDGLADSVALRKYRGAPLKPPTGKMEKTALICTPDLVESVFD